MVIYCGNEFINKLIIITYVTIMSSKGKFEKPKKKKASFLTKHNWGQCTGQKSVLSSLLYWVYLGEVADLLPSKNIILDPLPQKMKNINASQVTTGNKSNFFCHYKKSFNHMSIVSCCPNAMNISNMRSGFDLQGCLEGSKPYFEIFGNV